MRFINFDKSICCDDVIQCIFNLNDLDIKTFHLIKKNKELSTNEISKKLKKERSTIQRSLQRLLCSGLCEKKSNNLKHGGYYYSYSIKNQENIKKNLEKCIDNWYKKMKDTIKNL